MNYTIYRVLNDMDAKRLYNVMLDKYMKTGDYFIDEEVFFDNFWMYLIYEGVASDDKIENKFYLAKINLKLYKITKAYKYEDYLKDMFKKGKSFRPKYIIIKQKR